MIIHRTDSVEPQESTQQRRATLTDEPSPDLNPFQGAGLGLDFDYLRERAVQTGIELGEEVTLAQFDDGWCSDHPFFDSYLRRMRPFEQLGMGDEALAQASHGTSVLGLLVGGFDDVLDLSPLVPGVRIVLADARDKLDEPAHKSLADAIELLAESRCGVLLIARDWSSRAPHLPYELRPGVAGLLASAARRGVVVVEAAGNGGLCLDNLVQRHGPLVRGQITITNDAWLGPQDEQRPAFDVESGALIVAATTSSVPFQRWSEGFATNPQPKSNFGARIDCSAPGEHLFTAAGPGTGGRPGYTQSFGGTSAAAAIVAAAVAAIQSLAIRETGSPLGTRMVRSLFSNPALGSPVEHADDRIGPVPNLRLIFERALGTNPAT